MSRALLQNYEIQKAPSVNLQKKTLQLKILKCYSQKRPKYTIRAFWLLTISRYFQDPKSSNLDIGVQTVHEKEIQNLKYTLPYEICFSFVMALFVHC